MLSPASINELAIKWQTTILNVEREYLQSLFLSYLYQFPESEKLAFKGGTALRLLYRSPRYSEDLDFTGNLKPFHIEKLLSKTTDKIRQEIHTFETQESKPTSGGFLALYKCVIHAQTLGLELNVSLRSKAKTEAILVTSALVPSYQCLALPLRDLVREKCEALLMRKKPRDFFDLYFLLRERLGIEAILPIKERLIESVKLLEPKRTARELKAFLPVSHHQVISNLRSALLSELNRL